jgi:hypothetical protein
MNTLSCLFLCIALPSIAAAQNQFERELAQLRDQRDKAAKAATEPIDRRYKAALEQTLRRAMQANDLEAAVKIKAALSLVGAEGADDNSTATLQLLMEGSRWEWYDHPEPKGVSHHSLEFFADGTGRTGWGTPLKYTVTSPNTLRVVQGDGAVVWHFVVDVAKKVATHDAAAGGDLRSMKFERRISSPKSGR